MGSSPTPQPVETMDQTMAALTKWMPELSKQSIQQISPQEAAIFEAQQKYQPEYTKMQADLYNQYAPGMNQTANQMAIDAQRQQTAAESELLKGPGSDLIRQQNVLQRELDPEYYRARGIADQLLGSYDPTGKLSGSDQAEVERGLNRMNTGAGIAQSPTSTGAITNAMAFGDKQQSNKNALAQALANVGNSIGGLKSGTSVQSSLAPSSNQAANASNTGGNKFLGVNQPNIGAAGQNLFSQGLNSATSMSQNVNQTNAANYGNQLAASKFSFGFGPLSFSS